MKNTAHHYAKAFLELAENQEGEDLKKVARSFCLLLKKKGQWKMRRAILNRLTDLWHKKNQAMEIKVQTRFPLTEQERNAVENFVSRRYPDQKIILSEEIKDEIIGGIKIKVADRIFDMSLSAQLRRLQNLLANK